VRGDASPPAWLWNGLLLAIAAGLAGGLILLTALAAGWNDPRPPAPPDWSSSEDLLLSVPRPEERAVRLVGTPGEAFTLEAVAYPTGGTDFSGYGLAFHAQGADRYDVFAVGGDGYLAVLRVEGQEEIPLLDWRAFPHVRRGPVPNRLRLSCTHETCRFWVNDEFVASLAQTTGPPGDVGVWARRFEGPGLTVRFAQVAVWTDGP
jgi:hypothetical protein